MKQFLQELRRRRVFRTGAVYIVAAWVAIQVASEAFPGLGIADSAIRYVWIGALLGFPLALIFSWFYEITPNGITHTAPYSPDAAPDLSLHRLDYLILGALVLVIAAVTYGLVGEIRELETPKLTAPRQAAPNSIVVLPFVNMSPDPEQEYFSDGLTEELLNLLAGVEDLKVIARTSSFFYKGKLDVIPLTQIAEELSVAHVLEGSVRKGGDKIRITAQLIKADDGFHLWSQTWDRNLDDVFAIQDEIAAAVVDALKITLLGGAPRAKILNTESFELTLQGRYFYYRRAKGDVDRAREAFERAVELDPNNATAWVGLVSIYTNFSDPPDVTRAREAAEKALALEPDDPQANVRLGTVLWFEDKPEEAMRAQERAFELGPNDPLLLGMQGHWKMERGDLEGAIEMQRRSVQEDPLSILGLNNLAGLLTYAGQLDEAEKFINRGLELSPGNDQLLQGLGHLRLLQGRPGETLELLSYFEEDVKALMSRRPDQPSRLFMETAALFSVGDLQGSDRALAEFVEGSGGELPAFEAALHAWRGEQDAAFEKLFEAQAQGERSGRLSRRWMATPYLASLRDDPRWEQFLAGEWPEYP